MSNDKKQYLWNLPKTGCSMLVEYGCSSLFLNPSLISAFKTVSTSSLIINEDNKGVFFERSFSSTKEESVWSTLFKNSNEFNDRVIPF
mmetsp:Transcript_13485/g.11975  ORF Transcript_13485/g.11975 Transcript_13485/m.11975 type:complete len:88 (-) Transcript_13485:123-386(-)